MAEITNYCKLNYTAKDINAILANAITKVDWEGGEFDKTNGTKIGTLTIGNTENEIYTPSATKVPEVKWTQDPEVQEGGTKIGTLTIGETKNDVYAPTAEGGTELPTISGTVTKTIGGINKDTTYNNASIASVLTDLLFPYVALSNLSISTIASSGTKEYGTKVEITEVTPYFTLGSKPIKAIKIGTTRGGSDLYSGSTATSGTAIPLTTSKTFSGTTDGTIYCRIIDTDDKYLDATASVSYAYYTYYAVTNSTTPPTSWTSVGSESVRDITINANADQYIWIASTGNYANIYELNELSNGYGEDKLENASPTTKTTSQTLTNSQKHTCTKKYNFYRLTEARTGNGSSKFLLK